MWFTALLGIFDPISKIAKAIADAKIAATKAETDQEKIHAQERVDTLQARQAVLIAESGSRLNPFMRAMIAFGPAVYLTKIFVFDKVIGSFAGYTKNIFQTDPLDDNLWKVVVAVIGFYFLYDMASRLKR